MGWLDNVTTDATVVVSKTKNVRPALRFDDGNVFCNIDVVEHSTITEYRGLSESCADSLVAGTEVSTRDSINVSISNNFISSRTTVPNVIGTERRASSNRANEAGAYTVTIEEIVVEGPSSINGTGSLSDYTSGDVTYSYGPSKQKVNN